jgi:hypothetical protein
MGSKHSKERVSSDEPEAFNVIFAGSGGYGKTRLVDQASDPSVRFMT